MPMKKNATFVIILICLCVHLNVNAQQILQLFEDDLYRLNYNPASPVSTNIKGSVGFVFSNILVQGNTNLLTFNNFAQNDEFNLTPILKNVSKINNIHSEINMEIIGAGFRILKTPNNYFTINYRIRSDIYGFIPGDLTKTLINGTCSEFNHIVNADIEANASAYNELSVGYQHSINKLITVGGRVKFLMGNANYTTSESTLYSYTEPDTTLHIGGHYNANYSIPYNFSQNQFNIKSLYSGFGGGFDLGVNVNFPFNLEVNAAILDLGWIRWKSPTAQTLSVKPNPTSIFYQNQEIIVPDLYFNLNDYLQSPESYFDYYRNYYETLDYSNLTDESGYIDFNKFEKLEDIVNYQEIIDTSHHYTPNELETILSNYADSLTLKDVLSTNTSSTNSYTSMIYPKLILSAYYKLKQTNISHTFSFISRTDFVRHKAYATFTFGYNLRVKKFMDVALSYTLGRKSYKNLGIGLAFNAKDVFHFYMGTDNLISLCNYKNSNYFNAQFGIYFTIPYKGRPHDAKT